MRRDSRCFSLLEVVVAIGVFALGVVVVIGLFAPIASSVGRNADAETAANLGDVIKSELAGRVRLAGSFDPVIELLQPGSAIPAGGSTDVHHDGQLLFVSRDGSKIGGYDAPVWGNDHGDKYFEVALLRNESLSPAGADRLATIIVYTARIRWPAPVSGAAPKGQHVLFVNGSLCR